MIFSNKASEIVIPMMAASAYGRTSQKGSEHTSGLKKTRQKVLSAKGEAAIKDFIHKHEKKLANATIVK